MTIEAFASWLGAFGVAVIVIAVGAALNELRKGPKR